MRQDDVKGFYNQFLKSRMLNYRLRGNLRLQKAEVRIRPFVTKTSRVLDVGCGIGIVTECIAKQATQGRVWGVDLSPENISYATRTIGLRNLSFLDSDVVTGFDKVERVLGGPVDLITMIDVIEHIPEEDRGAVLHNLRRVAKNDALLILTYPSPQYQQYLREKDPKELQIIDNIIPIETLLAEARAAGFFLRHYSLETVWQKNQYVHCIFETDPSLAATQPPSGIIRMLSAAQRVIESLVLFPYRRHKYVSQIFRER